MHAGRQVLLSGSETDLEQDSALENDESEVSAHLVYLLHILKYCRIWYYINIFSDRSWPRIKRRLSTSG